MAFSFSAPVITEEDEQVERDNLTEEERQTVYDDLHGSGVHRIQETEDMRAQGLVEMEQHLTSVPQEKKRDYLEAMKRCPDLVEEESNPLLFLRTDDYDAKVSYQAISLGLLVDVIDRFLWNQTCPLLIELTADVSCILAILYH